MAKLVKVKVNQLRCDHSNESCCAVLSFGAVYHMLYKVLLTFVSVECDNSNESY